MDIARTVLLWVLGVLFLGAGSMKAFLPMARLRSQPNMGWIERTGPEQARVAGWAELLAGLTFIGTALDVAFLGDSTAPALIAALGIAVIMVLAAVRVHRPAGEPIVPNVVLGALALVLAALCVA